MLAVALLLAALAWHAAPAPAPECPASLTLVHVDGMNLPLVAALLRHVATRRDSTSLAVLAPARDGHRWMRVPARRQSSSTITIADLRADAEALQDIVASEATDLAALIVPAGIDNDMIAQLLKLDDTGAAAELTSLKVRALFAARILAERDGLLLLLEDRLDESTILLARAMCWDLADLLAVDSAAPLPARPRSTTLGRTLRARLEHMFARSLELSDMEEAFDALNDARSSLLTACDAAPSGSACEMQALSGRSLLRKLFEPPGAPAAGACNDEHSAPIIASCRRWRGGESGGCRYTGS